MFGIGRLRGWAKYYITKPLKRTMILLYHRIGRLTSDPQKLCVTPENFDEHLSVIRRHFYPISLNNASRNLANGRVTNYGLIITFDDGYADNLYHAKTILEKHDIPATIFVVSDSVDSDQEFYWDDLERILLMTPNLPDYLKMFIGGQYRFWDLKDVRKNQIEHTAESIAGPGNAGEGSDPSLRHGMYQEFCSLLRVSDVQRRENILEILADWAQVSRTGRKSHRSLTRDELLMLSDGGLVEIGAHTKSHVQLSKMQDSIQKNQIVQGKAMLENILGKPMKSFSYPFGSRHDYNNTSVKLVRESGFVSACSNFTGHVHHWSDPFQLPRFIVRNWDGNEFERQLRQWM